MSVNWYGVSCGDSENEITTRSDTLGKHDNDVFLGMGIE